MISREVYIQPELFKYRPDVHAVNGHLVTPLKDFFSKKVFLFTVDKIRSIINPELSFKSNEDLLETIKWGAEKPENASKIERMGFVGSTPTELPSFALSNYRTVNFLIQFYPTLNLHLADYSVPALFLPESKDYKEELKNFVHKAMYEDHMVELKGGQRGLFIEGKEFDKKSESTTRNLFLVSRYLLGVRDSGEQDLQVLDILTSRVLIDYFSFLRKRARKITSLLEEIASDFKS